jgi:alpha-tubulin suppressor-like RCC1 family protein
MQSAPQQPAIARMNLEEPIEEAKNEGEEAKDESAPPPPPQDTADLHPPHPGNDPDPEQDPNGNPTAEAEAGAPDLQPEAEKEKEKEAIPDMEQVPEEPGEGKAERPPTAGAGAVEGIGMGVGVGEKEREGAGGKEEEFPMAENALAAAEKEEAHSVASVNENLGYLIQICAGKQHILHLTEDGQVYSYGSGMYGVCGQGGAACCFQHQVLRSLSDRKVLQIACGEYHSLALTRAFNIYAWGRGFEGQLGIAEQGKTEIVSRPTFIPFFDKLPIKFIAAGSFYSLAITEQGELYGWGEARLGQLGCGRQKLVFTPQKIVVKEEPDDVLHKTHSSVSLRDAAEKSGPENGEGRVRKVAAGFGHTAAIMEDGQLYMWGLNAFGQLGIGDKKDTRYHPVRVVKDITNNWLPKARDVGCGYNFTIMIDCTSYPSILS